MINLQQQPPPNPVYITAVESSIKSLIANWNRRQRLRLLIFHRTNKPDQPQEHQQSPRKAAWGTRMSSFLESTPVYLFFLSLILLDLILAVLDLCSSLLSCTKNNRSTATQALVYHWGGIAILSILSVRTLALAVGLGRSFFFCPGRVVDGVVVMGALTLEWLVAEWGSGLLLQVSVWRVLRIVESAFELIDEAIETQTEGIICQFEALRDKNERLMTSISERDALITELKEELAQRGMLFCAAMDRCSCLTEQSSN